MYQLIRILHGFDFPMWQKEPLELTGLPVGIVGLGVSGGMIADALQAFGAKVSYYSRTRKPEKEKAGISYLPLEELLEASQAVITCLNKNVILLHEEQFAKLGSKKILINTSIGPSFDLPALEQWAFLPGQPVLLRYGRRPGRRFRPSAPAGQRDLHGGFVGRTSQAFELLSRKVLDTFRPI